MFYLNDRLNPFYLWLYGTAHMVEDHSDNVRKPADATSYHRLLFPISGKGSFISTIPHRIAHAMVFITPVVQHQLEREIA